MDSHYTKYMQALNEGVLNSPGEIESSLRRAVEALSAKLSGRTSHQTEQVPAELESYVTKVALHAYKVTDRDIEALREAGYSEDAIFELTVSTALGAGMARLERGLSVLEGAIDATQNH